MIFTENTQTWVLPDYVLRSNFALDEMKIGLTQRLAANLHKNLQIAMVRGQSKDALSALTIAPAPLKSHFGDMQKRTNLS